MFLKHFSVWFGLSTLHCAGCCTESTQRVLLHESSCAETLKGSKAKYEGTAATYISQQTYPKCQSMAWEWVTPLTSGDFWSIDLRPWFELLLSSCDFSHTGGSAGVWARPSKAQSYGVTGVFFRVREQQGTSVGCCWPWHWFWPRQWPTLHYHLWHVYFCRSFGFCFGCWFGSWILGTIFRNCKIPSEPCNADLLNNLLCFPWGW